MAQGNLDRTDAPSLHILVSSIGIGCGGGQNQFGAVRGSNFPPPIPGVKENPLMIFDDGVIFVVIATGARIGQPLTVCWFLDYLHPKGFGFFRMV
jgi:hypothetical protein